MSTVNQYTISIPYLLAELPDGHFVDEMKAGMIRAGGGDPKEYRFFKLSCFDPVWRRTYSRIDAIHRTLADQAFMRMKSEVGIYRVDEVE